MKKILLIVTLIIYPQSNALVVGSNSAVAREAQTTFPASDSDNEMLGFSWFEDGFILEDSTTTCTFNAFTPVSGDISLNSGTLFLRRDLMITNTVSLETSGKIFGNSFGLFFPAEENLMLPSNNAEPDFIFEDVSINFNTDVTLSASVQFEGTCLIEGNNHILDLSGSIIKINPASTLIMRNVLLVGVSGTNIRFLDSLATLTLENVMWTQDDDYTMTLGHIDFFGEVTINGGKTFAYQSDQVSTINSYATVLIDHGVTFSYDPSSANSSLLAMTDETSTLFLQNATLHSTATGLELTKGTLVVEGASAFSSEAIVQAEAIKIGDGTAANDLTIEVLPGASLSLSSGYLDYNNVA